MKILIRQGTIRLGLKERYFHYMARFDEAKRQKREEEAHRRQTRRNQVIFAVLSIVLILSMVLSLLISL